MALHLQKTLKNGISADYWRIVRINHTSRGSSEVFLGLFLSTDIEDDGMLDVKVFNFDTPKSVYTSENCYEWAYTQIKASRLDEEGNETNEFTNATDC